ncbi:O-antigen ligase domain-containing protein [Modicisalibacter radicis]|uniref:O-antigen ligase domain-containing protein n=1 Tax=Halomonas sp. EAR18 TaxID=2518972 RepID=UPI00109C0854|nr:O-antigen ligase domain-containing protein [Halomonas sp. EAR18]
MAAPTHHPANAAEKLISVAIQSTWLLWMVGGLYIAGPALAWILALMAAVTLYVAPALPAHQRPPPLHPCILLWLAGMLAMLLILIAGHLLNDLGIARTIKSSIGWAKGWALIALFPFAGAVLSIRPEIIYRAVCRLGLQTLLLLPLFLVAPFIGLPGLLYVSPLKVVGGSGPEYFAVILYTLEPGSGIPRWQFFAPWSPAAGMIAIIHVLCALEEKQWKWKIIGVSAALLVALLCQSRLALVALAIVWPTAFGISQLRKSWIWFSAAIPVLVAGLLMPQLMALMDHAIDRFTGARADSSRVRAALGRIAVERWKNEAPWFGHGVVERGPHLVEYMPIGSHHSWYGLLFVKGITGAFALAVPLFATILVVARLSLYEPIGRVAFSLLLLLTLYTFGENLEILSYLYWPALVLVGIACRTATQRRLKHAERRS